MDRVPEISLYLGTKEIRLVPRIQTSNPGHTHLVSVNQHLSCKWLLVLTSLVSDTGFMSVLLVEYIFG